MGELTHTGFYVPGPGETPAESERIMRELGVEPVRSRNDKSVSSGAKPSYEDRSYLKWGLNQTQGHFGLPVVPLGSPLATRWEGMSLEQLARLWDTFIQVPASRPPGLDTIIDPEQTPAMEFAKRFMDVARAEGEKVLPYFSEDLREHVRQHPEISLWLRHLPWHGEGKLGVPRMTCAVRGCRLRLNRQHWDEGGTMKYAWVHGRPSPIGQHKVVPVLQEYLAARLICDFCSEFDPEWLLGAKDAEYARTTADGEPITSHSAGWAWAACQACKELFDAGDVEGVSKRALEHITASEPVLQKSPAIRATFMAENMEMHRDFYENRTHIDRLLTDGERGLLVADDDPILSEPS